MTLAQAVLADMKKATVPGRRRGLSPILQDPREEEGAFATVKGPVDPLFSEPRAREEEGPMVPTCALREEEESDVPCPASSVLHALPGIL